MVKLVDGNDNVYDLEMNLQRCVESISLFFSNKFEEARLLMVPDSDTNIMHATALSMHSVIHAFFTMEKHLIDEAIESLHSSLKICARHTKVSSLGQSISRLFVTPNYNQYTDLECHAELLTLEMNFLLTLMSFLTDQSFLSLIRAAKYSMAAHSYAKSCNQILQHKTNWDSEFSKKNFACGAQLSWGMMNLLFSHLPARVIKIISLVGLPGSREEGLSYLKAATADESKIAMRWKLCTFFFCMYSFYIEQMLGVGELDLEWIKCLTEEGLERFPDGAFDLYWGAKTYQLRGHTDKAIELYNKSIQSQSEFLPLHSICRWDLLWCYAVNFDWHRAAELSKRLQEECNWSKATNAYQYACFTYMIMEEENRPELRVEVDAAMASVAELRRRYAGKTIPPEKFAVTMAERYNSGEKELVLPALMLFYIWNVYDNSVEKSDVLEPLLKRVTSKLTQITSGDSYYVLLLLKGVCLRNMKRLDEAFDCFVEILRAEEDIVQDNYVPPHAAFELGMTYRDMGAFEEARTWLVKARDSYTGFLVETLVHLRIHGALGKMKESEKRHKE